MKDKPRIGTNNESRRIEICNANYAPSGNRIGDFAAPWNVFTPWGFRTFATHTEALDYALAQVPPPDPTPQEQESVTTGWAPPPDREAAWQEKWDLTR